MGSTTSRMIAAELLKLRKRRGLLWTTGLGTVGATLVALAIVTALHGSDPEGHASIATRDNMDGLVGLVGVLTGLVGIVVGATAGAGDVRQGVFRDLVATGRSRLALFGVRLPGALLFLLPFMAITIALVVLAPHVLGDGVPAPEAGYLAESAGYLVASVIFGTSLGLGLASLVGSQAIGQGIALAWQLVVSPLVGSWSLLGDGRKAFSATALAQLSPGQPDVRMSLAAASVVLLLWIVGLLAVGAWRTATRDA